MDLLRLTKLFIPTIDNTSFVRYRNVTSIHITYCSIMSVKDGTFDSLWRLEKLNFNEIFEFSENFGFASRSLKSVGLWAAFNRSSVPLLTNLTKLTSLNIGGRVWKHVDLSNFPKSLIEVSLNYALNNSVSPNFTAFLPNLKIIKLRGNDIQEFPAENIQDLYIIEINLRKNLQVTIPDPMAYPFLEILQLRIIN